MPEILTESFCERCGTRYTFEPSGSAHDRFTRVRTLSKGLRNYVLSDETSFGEAMAVARTDEVRRTSGEQLDAFHKTFNFCMSCRQYTCANCWNEVEGRCLTCAPNLGREILAAPFQPVDPLAGPSVETALAAANGNGNGHVHANGNGALGLEATAWPTVDLDEDVPGVASPTNGHDLDAIASTDDPDIHAFSAMDRLDALLGSAPAAETVGSTETEPIAAESTNVALVDDANAGPVFLADVAGPELEPASEPEPEPEPVAPEVHAQVSARSAVASRLEAVEAEPEASTDADAPVETESATGGPVDVPAAAEVGAAVEAAPEPAEPSGDGDGAIHDLEGWAASAAAQTSTLLDRFRAFRGGERAPRPERRPIEPDIAALAQPAGPAVDEAPFVASVEGSAGIVGSVAEPATVDEPAFADVAEPTPETEIQEAFAEQPASGAVNPEPIAAGSVTAEAEPIAAEFVAEEPVAAESATAESVVAEPVDAREPVAETASEIETGAEIPAMPEVAPVAPLRRHDDRVEAPIWQIVAPDVPLPNGAPNGSSPASQPQWPGVAHATSEPQWPAAPAWPTRPQPHVTAADAVWAASSRDLLNRPETGVQACVSCGLALSATARFCRRCGSSQTHA
jgi:hypothetical protein